MVPETPFWFLYERKGVRAKNRECFSPVSRRKCITFPSIMGATWGSLVLTRYVNRTCEEGPELLQSCVADPFCMSEPGRIRFQGQSNVQSRLLQMGHGPECTWQLSFVSVRCFCCQTAGEVPGALARTEMSPGAHTASCLWVPPDPSDKSGHH